MKPSVIVDHPSPDDVARLEAEVLEFNYSVTGYRDGRELAAFVRDDAGAMVAGLSGFTWGGYCKVEFLWVTAARRRSGLGTALIAAAEAEARARGCDVVLLDTHDFQAPKFYERLGYAAVGRADDCPRGSGQTWYRKRLG